MNAPAATLAELCAAAMPHEELTADELAWICSGPTTTTIGDDRAAAVVTIDTIGEYVGAWLVLVVVHPDDQGAGRGRALVDEVVALARGANASDLHLAAAIPRYVWPGVDVMDTRAAAFCEAIGFADGPLGINMAISTAFRAVPPDGVIVERELGAGALELCDRAYPHWRPEVERAIELGTAFSARAPDGATVGFSCHSVNRRRWIGPMATDPDRRAGGIGSATLAAVCADLEARGEPTGEIAWVSNLRFYGKCGATVSRVFRGGRQPLRAPR
ncbi:MAG TPA: GNAT family N-acetyltransferase [Acidimicrobiia bacterium]|nr:GNAT family N-acetyltransferase [Acidimicrobiia bacterium]